jgi:DNA-binding transcriptional ArsR family regulator
VVDRIELILHPIRMRILMLAAGVVVTPGQIAARMSDVPQTTLYRHINMLIDGGILKVVRETKVRGTLEREITLPQGTARINPREVAALPPEEQFFYFLSFISTLLYDFTAHQQRGSEGIVLYTKQRVYATPEEIMALSGQVEAILAPYLDPERGEQPWLFSGIVMPDAGGLEAQHKDET